jgi:dienelactone hydrolase
LFSLRLSLILAAMRATVLIATDVFGNTPAIASLRRQLNAPCLVVSPFEADFQAQTEQQAYQAFLASGGVAAYANKIRTLIEEQTQLRHIIGFSVGASAWWMGSAAHSSHLETASLFYGSRIRNYLNLASHCPTHFIFAEHEAAFQVDLVVKSLKENGHQAEIALGCRHGFMNPYSSGFSLKNQTRYVEILAAKVHAKVNTENRRPIAQKLVA